MLLPSILKKEKGEMDEMKSKDQAEMQVADKKDKVRKEGEICCMCTDGSVVKDAEDYGYDDFLESLEKKRKCQDECEDKCKDKSDDDHQLEPYTGMDPFGCYDESLLAMVAPMFNAAGLARIKRDDKPGDYC